MRKKANSGIMNRVLAGVLAALLLVSFATPAVFATKTTSQVWNIYYTSDACSSTGPGSTVWTPSASDGGGFGVTNLPGGGSPNISGSPSTIYIYVPVTGGQPSTTYYYEIDGGNTPYPGYTTLLTTDSSGSGHGCISVDTSGFASYIPCTVPEKIAKGSPSSTDFVGHIIDHLLASTYPSCSTSSTTSSATFPPPSVPEFANFAGIGFLALIMALLPAMLLLRKKALLTSR